MRTDGVHCFVFVENYTEHPVELSLDGGYTDMESGESVERVGVDVIDDYSLAIAFMHTGARRGIDTSEKMCYA